jgi:hypothetical protein
MEVDEMPFDRKTRRVLKRCFKDIIEQKSGYDLTVENAGIRKTLDRCWSNGQIGVAVTGMDCDCSAYGREYTVEMPNCVAAFKRWFDKHIEYLDGPESQRFMRPEEVDKSNHYSRDLALEAFEDGHPHVVRDWRYAA